MKQSPSAESDTETHSANQEVPKLLWDQGFITVLARECYWHSVRESRSPPALMGPRVYYCACKRVLLALSQRIKKSPSSYGT